MKNTTHNVYEAPEKQHYKKGYLQRKLEEKDAEQQIKSFALSKTQDVEEERVVQFVPPRIS